MYIAKNKECLKGEDGFYIDRSRTVTLDGLTLFGIDRVKTDGLKKTSLFKSAGGVSNDYRG